MRTAAPPINGPPTELAGPPLDVERLHTLDILRGLALAGMILVHFHQRMRLPSAGWPESSIGWIAWIGLETKAWAVFAFLFGVGFALLLRRLEARGLSVVPIYLRRLFALGCFGVLALVAFGVDILLIYAIWGLPLLVVRHWSTRALLGTAALAVSIRPLYYAGRALYRWMAGVSPAPGDPLGIALFEARQHAATGGDYLALVQARFDYMLWQYLEPTQYLPDSSFGLFIIGLLALRHGIFDDPRRHVRLIVAWSLGGLLSWAVSWLLLSKIPDLPIRGLAWTLRFGLGLVQEQWLAFAYIGAVVLLLAYRTQWTKRLLSVGFTGRMALTNYLVQAAVVDFMASSYGLNLKLRPYLYAFGALLLFALLTVASRAWLAQYRFGPAEWLWRALTYGSVPAFRRAHVTNVTAGAA